MRPASRLLVIPFLALLVAAPASASPATRSADRQLDRALQKVVDQDGGPPGVIAVVQRGRHREFHTAGFQSPPPG